jgi:hypothetical protein
MLIVSALMYVGLVDAVSVDSNTGPELVPGVTVE